MGFSHQQKWGGFEPRVFLGRQVLHLLQQFDLCAVAFGARGPGSTGGPKRGGTKMMQVMGVSKNGGTPKRMIYDGNPYYPIRRTCKNLSKVGSKLAKEFAVGQYNNIYANI